VEENMEGLIVVVVFVVLVIVTLVLGVRIVPQGSKHVVQRLGKYQKTFGPGLNIIIPYIDSVAHKVTTKDIVLDIPSQEVITRDNAVIIANAVAYMNIISPGKGGVRCGELPVRHPEPGTDLPACHRGRNGS
jgi:regulator of protease activity HflC (stomatin/prohibitin superfamily)